MSLETPATAPAPAASTPPPIVAPTPKDIIAGPRTGQTQVRAAPPRNMSAPTPAPIPAPAAKAPAPSITSFNV